MKKSLLTRPSWQNPKTLFLFGGVIFLLLTLVLVWAMVEQSKKSQDARSQASEGSPELFGVDYNLTRRCIKGTNPTGLNYFQDLQQCLAGKNWTIAVQAEKTLGQTCTGVVNQSIPLNGTGPMTLEWLNHTDEFGKPNYTIHMKTDFSSKTHPCGDNTYTWYAFMDHVNNGGGPHLRPDQITHSFRVNHNDYAPNGSVRVMAGWQGYWNGKSYQLEIDLLRTNVTSDAYPTDPQVIQKYDSAAVTYYELSGAAYGLTIANLQEKDITIPWNTIVQQLVASGKLPAPTQGWTNSATVALYIATEVHNFSPTNAAISDIWFTNWREKPAVVPASPLPSPSPSPSPLPSPTPTVNPPSPTPSPSPTPKPPSPTPSPSPSPIAETECSKADINQSGTVDLSDYSILVSNFLKSPLLNPRADITGDKIADLRDFSVMVRYFLKPCSP